jgi:hypothetical protein
VTNAAPFHLIGADGRHGLMSADGEVLVPPALTEICFFFEGLAAFCRDQRWGVLDVAGREVIAPRYQLARQFSDGRCAMNLGSWRYVDPAGKELRIPGMKYAGDFSGGLAAVANDALRWGFVDHQGHLVIPHAYDDAGGFSEGLCAVKTRKGWGYVDRAGAWVIEPRFKRAWGFRDGLAQVVSTGKESRDAFAQLVGTYEDGGEFRGKWGVIDRSGAYRVAPRFEYSESAVASTIRRRTLGPSGLGVLPPIVEGAAPHIDGHYRVKTKRGWGYVNAKGDDVAGPFDRAGEPAEGHALVLPKYGDDAAILCLAEGVLRVPRFAQDGLLGEPIGHFVDGLAPLALPKDGGLRWGYVDPEGGWVIPPTFAFARTFERGLAWVAGLDRVGYYIDRAGARVGPRQSPA